MKILLIEDDRNLSEVLAEALSDHLYAVDMASDADSALEQIQGSDYDLLLLDVMLPGTDGLSLCQHLRSQNYQMPILMITALDTVRDKIMGLDVGADDYLVKPVDLGELLARIRALLRRGKPCLPPILQWGALSLDPSTYEASYDHSKLHLTPKEYCLLELLLRNGRRVLSRRLILEHIWPRSEQPEEETVKVHLRGLRQKLKGVGAPDNFIETVHGLGYRLIDID